MSLSLLSKHRRSLMAIAMLWIGFYHSYFPFVFKPFSFVLARCGNCGVDLFLFLSAFGLFFSYNNNNNYVCFIKKRLLRILPYSIPFTLFSFLTGKEKLFFTIIDLLGLTVFFRSDLSWWFTSFILILYFVTPLYMKLFNKKPILVTFLFIIVVFIICLIVNNDEFIYVFYRVAPYLLGFYFAYLYSNKMVKQENMFSLILIVIMVVGWLSLYYLYHFVSNEHIYVYPYLLITPGLLMFLSWMIDKIVLLQKPLNYIGKYTFQFYLIQPRIINFLYKYYDLLYRPGIKFDYVINILGFILGFILTVLYKKIIDYLLNIMKISKVDR